MILIDTSAWIEFLRPGGESKVKSLVKDHLLEGRAAFTCPVMFELVLGARQGEMQELRGKGLNFPALDLVIASVAFNKGWNLLTTDSHFTRIRDEVLPGLLLL